MCDAVQSDLSGWKNWLNNVHIRQGSGAEIPRLKALHPPKVHQSTWEEDDPFLAAFVHADFRMFFTITTCNGTSNMILWGHQKTTWGPLGDLLGTTWWPHDAVLINQLSWFCCCIRALKRPRYKREQGWWLACCISPSYRHCSALV